MLAKAGLTCRGPSAADHRTLRRAPRVRPRRRVTLMPVLQGYDPLDYARHVLAYGDELAPGAYVGVWRRLQAQRPS